MSSDEATRPEGGAVQSAGLTALSMGIQQGAQSNLATVVAQEEGIFEAHGLQVEFVQLEGGAILPSLTSDAIQFVSQAPQLVATAIQQGLDLRFFCGNVNRDWTGISAPPDSGLPSVARGDTWEDVMTSLVGKQVGVAALGATQEHWMTGLSEAAGLAPGDITLVPVGVGAGAIAALEGGQVDAVLTYGGIEELLVAEGTAEVLFHFADDGPDVLLGQMNSGFVADRRWLDANPDVATNVCDAIGEGMAYAQDEDNAERMDEIWETEFGVANPDARAEFRNSLDRFSPEIDCEALGTAVGFLQQYGTLTDDPPLTCETMVWQP